MREMWLGLAASAAAILPAAPAAALDPAHSQFTAGAAAGVTVHRGSAGRFDGFRHGRRDRHRGDRRRDRGFDGPVYIDREYQGDSAWRSDGFNDWWHERPHRSLPRWVQNNDDCQRVWWSGGGWRC